MEIMKAFISVLLIGAVVITGCATGPPPVPTKLTIPSASSGEISNPKLVMAGCYEAKGLSISPSAPGYTLPLNLGEIANFGEIESILSLSENQKELLERNGFVLTHWRGDDIVQPYKTLRRAGDSELCYCGYFASFVSYPVQ